MWPPASEMTMNSEHDNMLDEALAARQRTSRAIVDVDEPQIKLVIFRLLDRYFAFPGSSIQEVISGATEVFYIPGMHASVEGVMNLRGDIQSVLTLNGLLQLSDSDARINGRAILLGSGAGLQTGIRIDQLLDVADVPRSLLKPPIDSLPNHLKPLVSALFEFDGLPVTLLDLDLVLQAWQQQIS